MQTIFSLSLVLLHPDVLSLCKQCRSSPVGSQLICICTVCHEVCEFVATIGINNLIGLILEVGVAAYNIRSGRGSLIYSAGHGLIEHLVDCQVYYGTYLVCLLDIARTK